MTSIIALICVVFFGVNQLWLPLTIVLFAGVVQFCTKSSVASYAKNGKQGELGPVMPFINMIAFIAVYAMAIYAGWVVFNH